jgi:hypothetical protein
MMPAPLPLIHTALLFPLLAHVALILFLFAWLTVARKRAVDSGETQWSGFVLGREEPLHVARITRNLANQFELPVLFYVAVLVIMMADAITVFDLAASWLFVAGRVIHTCVQTTTDNVKLRGQVFMINFIGVLGLLGHVGLIAIRGVSFF